MKKILATVLTCIMAFSLVACGNMDMIDTNYTFDYAIVNMFDGTSKKLEIKQWSDYDGEQIQIITTDGEIWLVSSVNCHMVRG